MTAMIILVILLSPLVYFLLVPDKETGIAIDGRFGEWARVTGEHDASNDTQGIDLIEYKVREKDGMIGLYLETGTDLFSSVTNEVTDGVYIFIDSGKNQNGKNVYRIGNFRADHLITIFGREGEIQRSTLSTYEKSEQGDDWNGWEAVASIEARSSGNELECSFFMSDIDSSTPLFLIMVKDRNGVADAGENVLSLSRDFLVIRETTTAHHNEHFSEFVLETLEIETRGEMSLETLNFASNDLVTWATLFVDTDTNREFDDGVDKELAGGEITADSSSLDVNLELGSDTQNLYFLQVRTASGVLDFHLDAKNPADVKNGRVFLAQDLKKIQANIDFTTIVIDGAFGDWQNPLIVESKDDDHFDVETRNNDQVDIDKYAVALDETNLSFMMSTVGTVMGGTIIPIANPQMTEEFQPFDDEEEEQDRDEDGIPDKDDDYPYDHDNDGIADDIDEDDDNDGFPDAHDKHRLDRDNDGIPDKFDKGEDGGKPSVRPPLLGKDYGFIFLDIDVLYSTGFKVPGVLMGADARISIEGYNGEITRTVYETWNTYIQQWETKGTLKAGKDDHSIETQIELAEFSLVGNRISVFFYLVDWNGNYDRSDELFSVDPNRARYLNESMATRGTGTDLILLWDGASAPTGWTMVSDDEGEDFYERFPRGAAIYGGSGGSATHTHTETRGTSTTPSASSNRRSHTTSVASGTHTHRVQSSSVSTDSHLPPYRGLKVIQYDTGIPTTIPTGAIAVFDAAVPSGWTRYSAQDNYYVWGAASIATGGSATHTHTVDITTGGPSATVSTKGVASWDASTSTHTHTGSDSTATASNDPPYLTVILGKADSDTSIPSNMIGLFDGSPGAGWDVVSESGGDFCECFIQGSSSYGSTGGSSTHTHTTLTITTGAPSATAKAQSGTGVSVGSSTHTHDFDVDFDNVNHLPPYIDVIFAKAQANNVPTLTGGNTWPDPNYVDVSGSSSTTISANFTDADDPGVSDFTVTIKVKDESETEYTLVNNQTNGGGDLTITALAGNDYRASYSWDPGNDQTLGDYDLYIYVEDGRGDWTEDSYSNNTDELTLTSTYNYPPTLTGGTISPSPASVDVFGTGSTTITADFSDVGDPGVGDFTVTMEVKDSVGTEYTIVDNQTNGAGGLTITALPGDDYRASYSWNPPNDQSTGDYDLYLYVKDSGSKWTEDSYANNSDELTLTSSNAAPTLSGGNTWPNPNEVDAYTSESTTITANFTDTNDPGVSDFTVTMKVRDPENTEDTIVDAKQNGESGLTITALPGNDYRASYTWDPVNNQTVGLYDLYFYVEDSGGLSATDGYASNTDELTLTSSNSPSILSGGSTWPNPNEVDVFGTGTTTISCNFTDPNDPGVDDFQITIKLRDASSVEETILTNQSHGAGGLTITELTGNDYRASYVWNPANDHATGVFDIFFYVEDSGGGFDIDSFDNNTDELTLTSSNAAPTLTGGNTWPDPNDLDVFGSNSAVIYANFTDTNDPGVSDFTVTIKVRDSGSTEYTLVDAKQHGESGLTISALPGNDYRATYSWDPGNDQTLGDYDLYFYVVDSGSLSATDGYASNTDELTLSSTENFQPTLVGDNTYPSPTSVDVLGTGSTTITAEFTDTNDPGVGDFTVTIKVRDESSTEYTLVNNQTNGGGGLTITALTGNDYRATYSWDPASSQVLGDYDIYFYVKDSGGMWAEDSYANNTDELTLTSSAGNLILFWDGVSAPTGWTIVSDDGGEDFYERFPRGSASYGSTGGAATHTHTASAGASTSASASMARDSGSTAMGSGAHTHTLQSSMVGTASNLPSYRNLKVISYDSGIPTTIPSGAIAIFDGTLPSGWTRYSAQDDYFVRGAGSIATGGANTHTHSVEVTTGAPSATVNGKSSSGNVATTSSHTHTGSGTSASGSNQPPSLTVVLAKATSEAFIPGGMIGMFDANPEGGWSVVSGSGGDFNNRFIKGSSSYGTTGGASSHTHTDLTVSLGTTSGTGVVKSGSGATLATDTHTHTIDASFSTDNQLPPYIDVIFARASSIPAYNDGDWVDLGVQQNDASTDAVDIQNAGNTKLQYQEDENFMYFQFFTQGDPDIDAYTYSMLLDDGGEGTYDYVIATYGSSTNVRLYEWSAVNGWDNANVITLDGGYFNFDTTYDVVQFAVAFSDAFTPASGDKAYAATYDAQADAFEEGQDWESTNNPTPDATDGDYTLATGIPLPEFGELLLPTVFMVLVFLYHRRRREHSSRKETRR